MAVTSEEIHIRAKIQFSDITVETPYIVSFNVNKARGQMCATCTASVKISSDDVDSLSGRSIESSIKIWAGSDSPKHKIFEGMLLM